MTPLQRATIEECAQLARRAVLAHTHDWDLADSVWRAIKEGRAPQVAARPVRARPAMTGDTRAEDAKIFHAQQREIAGESGASDEPRGRKRGSIPVTPCACGEPR